MNPVDVLKNIASGLDRIHDISRRLDEERADRKAFEQMAAIRFEALQKQLTELREQVARHEEFRQTVKEVVRAEITAAVAELRVRYAEQASAPKKQLPQPRKSR